MSRLVLAAAVLATGLMAPMRAHAGDIGDAVEFIEPYVPGDVEGLEKYIDANPDEALSVLLGRYDTSPTGTNEHALTDLGGVRLTLAQVRPFIEAAAAATGLPGALIDAVIRTESGYRPRARSRVGAMGLMQLMPGTAKEVGLRDPFDPRQNVLAGAKYLRKLYDRYGNFRLAVAAYNAGPGNVDKYNGLPPFSETKAYVRTVMSRYAKSKLSGVDEKDEE